MRLILHKFITNLPQRVQDFLRTLPLLALQPRHAMVLALLWGSVLQVHVTEAHADDVVGLGVDALVGELAVRGVPVGQCRRSVGLFELVGDALGEEDVDHQTAHGFVVEGIEVDVVDPGDVGDQRGEDDLNHLDGYDSTTAADYRSKTCGEEVREAK